VNVLLDDRLLIEELLVGLDRRGTHLYTTTYWYYRACRAAIVGSGGHLSGPFREVRPIEQRRAVAAMLRLPEDIGLPEPRQVVPGMVDVASRHPRLNLLNLEAVAAARVLDATVWLSPDNAAGLLTKVLRHERLRCETVPVG
jgi:hypothetical protein